MNPEQRFTVIVEYLAVESLVFLLRAVIRMLCPQRMNVRDAYRSFVDLYALTRRRDLNRLLPAVSVILLFRLRVFVDMFYHDIGILELTLIDGLIFLRRICLLQEDLHRHKAAVALKHFTHAVFVRKLKAVLVQVQDNRCSDLFPVPVPHRVGGRTVALPVHSGRALLIAECVNLHIVGDHEYGIESKAEMTDNVILVRLVFIFFKECSRTGKRDLCNILFHLVSRHAKSGIRKADSLRFRIDYHVDGILMIIRILVLAHDLKLVQLRDRVTRIRDHFTHKDIVIRIQPLLNNRKHILAVD